MSPPPFGVSLVQDKDSHDRPIYNAREVVPLILHGRWAIEGRPVTLDDLQARGCPIFETCKRTKAYLAFAREHPEDLLAGKEPPPHLSWMRRLEDELHF